MSEGGILVCAATAKELEVCRPPDRELERVAFAVTGVGIPMTLLKLIPLLAELKPELVVNVGIAGAYPGSGLSIGELVMGRSEVFGDLGLETPGEEWFKPLGRLPWADAEYREAMDLSVDPFMEDPPDPMRIGAGCTVNACAGRKETGELRRLLFNADFETMEGAAVALAARSAGAAVGELRAVSNFAAKRDMRPENIALALGNLGAYMQAWLRRRG